MDMPYTLIQWIGFFFLYGFLGWCYESTYVSIKHRRWVNRGFMRGPLLPLYGSGAILLLFVTIPFRDSLILMFIAGAIGATALEYVTGVVMEFTEEIKGRSEEWKEQSEERKEARKERADAYREEWQRKANAYKEELDELCTNFRVIMEKRFQLLHHKDFFRRDMIRSNPAMMSKQFKEALEDLKRAAREKIDEVKKRE